MLNLTLKKYQDSEKEIWENINLSAESTSFLTSLDWIEFQKSLNKEIDQYLIYINEILVGNLYIEISRRKVAKYAYSPYGPVIDWIKVKNVLNNTQDFEKLLKDLFYKLKLWMQEYCKHSKVNLFKFDPLISEKYKNTFKKLEFKESLSPAQAIDTWELDISKSENEILKEQKKDTRYYMKRAGKQGAIFEKATSLEQVKAFGNLMQETTERKGFINYSTEYFLKQFQELNPKKMTEIYLVKFKDKYIAGALINFYKDKAYYAHGASTSDKELAKLAAPYFLHWEIIKDIKKRNIKKYNLWGVLPKEIKNHPWRGLSDFKMKFNGHLKSYIGPFETYDNFIKYNINRSFDWYSFRKERYKRLEI